MELHSQCRYASSAIIKSCQRRMIFTLDSVSLNELEAKVDEKEADRGGSIVESRFTKAIASSTISSLNKQLTIGRFLRRRVDPTLALWSSSEIMMKRARIKRMVHVDKFQDFSGFRTRKLPVERLNLDRDATTVTFFLPMLVYKFAFVASICVFFCLVGNWSRECFARSLHDKEINFALKSSAKDENRSVMETWSHAS